MSRPVHDLFIQLGLSRGRSQWEDQLLDQIEAAQRDAGLCPEQYIRNTLMPTSPAAQEAYLQLEAIQPAIDVPNQAAQERGGEV